MIMARDSDIPILFVLGIDVTESLPWLVESVKPVLVNVVRGRGTTDELRHDGPEAGSSTKHVTNILLLLHAPERSMRVQSVMFDSWPLHTGKKLLANAPTPWLRRPAPAPAAQIQNLMIMYAHQGAQPPSHRRRKILKVGGLKIQLRAKFFDHAHFCTIEVAVQCSQEFLDERTNSKSSRVDLAATYWHVYS